MGISKRRQHPAATLPTAVVVMVVIVSSSSSSSGIHERKKKKYSSEGELCRQGLPLFILFVAVKVRVVAAVIVAAVVAVIIIIIVVVVVVVVVVRTSKQWKWPYLSLKGPGGSVWLPQCPIRSRQMHSRLYHQICHHNKEKQ